MSPFRSNQPLDAIGRDGDLFVLPYSQHRPAGVEQPLIRIAIASDVGLDLLSPPFRVVLRPGAVRRATVPKTAIEKDRGSGAGEDDIDGTARTGQQATVQPKSEPAPMQLGSQGALARIVAPCRRCHPLGSRRRDGINWLRTRHAPRYGDGDLAGKPPHGATCFAQGATESRPLLYVKETSPFVTRRRRGAAGEPPPAIRTPMIDRAALRSPSRRSANACR